MNTKLDKWDFQLIRLFKTYGPDNHLTIDKIKKIWSERVAIELEYLHTHYVTEHLLKLAQKLNLFEKSGERLTDFIFSLEQKHNWKYICLTNSTINKDTTDFQTILLSRLVSLFSNALVMDLPGYTDFLKND